MDTCFSVGVPITEPIRAAISATPHQAWYPALDADGEVRDGAQIAEITGLVVGTSPIASAENCCRTVRGGRTAYFKIMTGRAWATGLTTGPVPTRA